jgi:hypothetical protein
MTSCCENVKTAKLWLACRNLMWRGGSLCIPIQPHDGVGQQEWLEGGLGGDGGETSLQRATVCQQVLGRLEVQRHDVAHGQLVDRALLA